MGFMIDSLNFLPRPARRVGFIRVKPSANPRVTRRMGPHAARNGTNSQSIAPSRGLWTYLPGTIHCRPQWRNTDGRTNIPKTPARRRYPSMGQLAHSDRANYMQQQMAGQCTWGTPLFLIFAF